MVKRGRIVSFFLIVIFMGVLIGTTSNNITKNIKLGLDLRADLKFFTTWNLSIKSK